MLKTGCYIYSWTLQILSLLKEKGTIWKLCWKEKKSWEESIQWQGIQPCKAVWRGELLPLFLNGTIQRAFRAIKSYLWQSRRVISAQKSCNKKVCAVDLELVYLVHLEGSGLLFMHHCHGSPNLATEAIHFQRARWFNTCLKGQIWSPSALWRARYDLLLYFEDPGTERFLSHHAGGSYILTPAFLAFSGLTEDNTSKWNSVTLWLYFALSHLENGVDHEVWGLSGVCLKREWTAAPVHHCGSLRKD